MSCLRTAHDHCTLILTIVLFRYHLITLCKEYSATSRTPSRYQSEPQRVQRTFHPALSPPQPAFIRTDFLAKMSGTSNVGSSSVYEAGDQRNLPDSQKGGAEPYEEGQKHSHQANDPSTSASSTIICFFAFL